jgi:hypothetical protein
MPTFTDFLNIEVPDENDTSWTSTLLSDFQILDGAAETISGTHLTASGVSLKGVVDVQGLGSVSLYTSGTDTLVISGTPGGSDISASSIGDLSDVDLSGLADNKILKYNSSSGNFEAEDDLTGGGGGDHSTLTNLDYASAGHTGFASSTELSNASGTLSAEIDSDISTHAAVADAHHAKYTDAEAVSALETTTDALATSGTTNASNLSSHTGDATIHFTEGSIDHTAITNIGVNTHAQIDTHLGALAASGTTNESNITINIADIAAVMASGTVHYDDATIHFTEGSIDHTAITNIGTNTHPQIDTHLSALATSGTSTQTQLDALDVVDTLNGLTGAVTVSGKGEVGVTVEGQLVIVSGTDHSAGASVDEMVIKLAAETFAL